jgi:hypothetical protein
LTAFGLAFLIFVIAFPALFQNKSSRRMPCLSNVKQMNLGLLMYAEDHDQTLPLANGWMDSIGRYVYRGAVFHDFEGVGPGDYGYALRESAGGLKQATKKEPEKFATVFDSILTTRSAHSDPSSMPHPGRHNGRDAVGFLDGHARALPMP